jgi:radical SAM protein with 4Fe4S-binding SPASM domain
LRIEAKELRGERKEKLRESVPLPFAWTLFLDVTNACNFKCIFCPTGNPDMLAGTKRTLGHMSMELFEKIVRDLKQAPRLKMLNLYKDGEPLVHRQFTRMVQMLKDADVSERLWVKTNGVLIERHPDLATCGLDMVGISVPGVNEQAIRKVAGVKVDYQRYVETVKRLYESSRTFEISVKIADTGLEQGEIDKFYHDFEDISDYISVEGLHGWSASDVKNLQIHDSGTFDGNKFEYKTTCPLPFYMMTVNWNGVVSVCNDDWGYWHQLGNVNNESLLEIWNGERYSEFRRMHLDGRRRDNKACGTCQYVNALPDNIDKYREEMRRRIYGA